MSNVDLGSLTNEQLVAHFIQASIDQSGYSVKPKTYNRLYDDLKNISEVFRTRGETARRSLLPLLNHSNAQVRLNAVDELIDLEPVKTRAVLEELAQRAPGPQRLRAGMKLLHLQRRDRKPS